MVPTVTTVLSAVIEASPENNAPPFALRLAVELKDDIPDTTAIPVAVNVVVELKLASPVIVDAAVKLNAPLKLALPVLILSAATVNVPRLACIDMPSLTAPASAVSEQDVERAASPCKVTRAAAVTLNELVSSAPNVLILPAAWTVVANL